jgi:hypothetical protein
MQWVPAAACRCAKRLLLEAGHSFPSSSEVKNGWSYTSSPHIYFHGVSRDNFTFTFETFCYEHKHNNVSGWPGAALGSPWTPPPQFRLWINHSCVDFSFVVMLHVKLRVASATVARSNGRHFVRVKCFGVLYCKFLEIIFLFIIFMYNNLVLNLTAIFYDRSWIHIHPSFRPGKPEVTPLVRYGEYSNYS